MRRHVAIAAITLAAVAPTSTPAAASEPPRVTGSAGCGEAGQFIGFVARNFGQAAVGSFVSTNATTGDPGAVAVGMNAFKAARCSAG